MKQVSIIDYGIGNILSVKRAFEKQGADVKLIQTKEELKNAEYLVLPGVGAFRDGMKALGAYGLIDAIKEYCAENRPFLGICLGMQMMLEESEEFGMTKGLGIIPGSVIKIEEITTEGAYQKVPHVGWNELRFLYDTKGTILEGMNGGEYMYFVHSYTVKPSEERYRLSDVCYGGRQIAAVVRKGNCYGTQFHPEKSGSAGLKIISNFLNL